ncbi:MAG: hypothetical protein IJN90_06695 [Bacilli bacterium]|nr:hypothetical protein [Bacilli bacterium]
MESLFTLKDNKHNFHLLAFQFHTLDYSVGVLKNKKKELRENPILKHKIDNYILMQKLALGQKMNGDTLGFDISSSIKNYINNPDNIDLKNYMNLCEHIIARELDMAELCSKIDFNGHLFTLVGNDLYCTDSVLSTVNSGFNDIEKNFLCSCAKRSNRIVRSNIGSNIGNVYQNKVDTANLLHVA